MRYTTIIDISEIQPIYRNVNARLVYLHLVLKSGYHDNDRDLVSISLRRIAAEVGLTLSATRHAISQLEKAQLLSSICSKVVFSDKLEQCATDEQREKGLDIADFLLMADTPMMTLQKMIRRCPGLQTLVDQFQLELVEQ